MKAEQRHQLHTNLLADRVGRFLKDMRSTRRTTSTLVWFFVLVALAAVVVWQYGARATQTENSELWSKVDGATHDPQLGQSDLQSVAEENPGTFPGRTARFQMARLYFQWGQRAFTALDRLDAIKRVNKARELYEKLAGECADAPLLAQEALMGVAKADEWLIGVPNPEQPEKDLEHALASYDKLADQYPGSILGKAARERARNLQEHSAEVVKVYRQLNQAAAAKAFDEAILPVPEAKVP